MGVDFHQCSNDDCSGTYADDNCFTCCICEGGYCDRCKNFGRPYSVDCEGECLEEGDPDGDDFVCKCEGFNLNGKVYSIDCYCERDHWICETCIGNYTKEEYEFVKDYEVISFLLSELPKYNKSKQEVQKAIVESRKTKKAKVEEEEVVTVVS
jgi:hypothetical protein